MNYQQSPPNHYGDSEQRVAALITTSIATHQPYTQVEGEELRANYEEIMGQSDWLERFQAIGQGILNTVADSTGQTAGSLSGADPDEDAYADHKLLLKLGDQCLTFPTDSNCLTIGRREGCQLMLPAGDISCSRLHIIIYRLMDRLLVVDLGSFLGVTTLKRSNTDQPVKSSLPQLRQTLQFGLTEGFVLKLGNQQVVVNPKTCVICLDRPRGYRNACGHYLMCMHCAMILTRYNNQCPICRQSITDRGGRPGNHLQSYVPRTNSDTVGVTGAAGSATGSAAGSAAGVAAVASLRFDDLVVDYDSNTINP